MKSTILPLLIMLFLFAINSCKKENNPPTISDQVFSVKENSTPGLVCATVLASDPDGDKLNYELVDSELAFPFELDANNGNVRIKQNAKIDYEKVQQYKFQVKVSDGKGSASAIVTINVTDQLETPNIADQSFTMNENIKGLYSVGIVKFESKCTSEEYEFSITEGNSENIFYIGEKSGELFLAEGKFLDFEEKNSYTIQLKIQNRANTSYQTIIKVEVKVNDANDKPEITDQSFSISEN
jgi:hypothetical protein